MGRILCSHYSFTDPLSNSLGHYGPWTCHIRPRVQNYLYFTLYYQRVEQVLLSLQVMKVKRIIKGVHNVSSEFCRFLEGGLATLGFIFSVISSSILKISVPIMQQISRTFQNTPNICILDEFEGSYGRFSTKRHFFWDTLYIFSFIFITFFFILIKCKWQRFNLFLLLSFYLFLLL